MTEDVDQKSIIEKRFVLGSLLLFIFDLKTHSMTSFFDRVCWPHFENCRSFLPMGSFQFSYNQSLGFALIFTVIMVGVVGVLKNKKALYLTSLWLLALFNFFYHFIWQFSGEYNFELFHLVPTFAFLINARNRIFAAQVSWCLCYFLAAFVKFHESWIVGNYFTSLSIGLPLIPKSVTPIISNGVILFEIFFSWTLLHHKLKKISLFFWSLFHIYSVAFVGFYYPTRCMMVLLTLFLEDSSKFNKPKQLSVSFLSLLLILLFFQLAPLMYEEDNKSTQRFEGYAYSMIDANFQCVSKLSQIEGEKRKESIQQYKHPMYRCSPHRILEKIRVSCKNNSIKKIEWQLYQSINGNPFFEIVNETDACNLKYSLFGENKWIKTNNFKVKGFPNYNYLLENTVNSLESSASIIHDRQIIYLTPLQEFIRKQFRYFYSTYLILWTSVLSYIGYLFLIAKE